MRTPAPPEAIGATSHFRRDTKRPRRPAAANFCETKRFTDMDLAVCMPTVSTYDSARDFIQHYVTYKGCRALTGADCSAARDYLYRGMGCAECGAWADLSALNEANCTALQTEPDCVGVDKSGHVYQETLGAGAPGAVIPAASAVESGDGAVANPVDDGVEDGGGDTGAAPGVSTALAGPGAILKKETKIFLLMRRTGVSCKLACVARESRHLQCGRWWRFVCRAARADGGGVCMQRHACGSRTAAATRRSRDRLAWTTSGRA